jgi:5-hydroxyisourate hydrolase
MGISTHILDTSLGKPAANVTVTLFRFRNNAAGECWEQIGSGRTDEDGRCKNLLGEHPLAATDYRLKFDVGAYFRNLGVAALYPFVEITFTVADPTAHFHIPLLVTANGYTTYRGS